MEYIPKSSFDLSLSSNSHDATFQGKKKNSPPGMDKQLTELGGFFGRVLKKYMEVFTLSIDNKCVCIKIKEAWCLQPSSLQPLTTC